LKSPTYPQFFNPQRIGESLKEVTSDILQTESNLLVGRWFHAPKDVDLFLWTDENSRIVKQQLTFFGQVVEWNLVEGNKTGALIEEEERGPVKKSESILFDVIAHPQPLSLAMAVIKHVDALTDAEKTQIITNFFHGQKGSDLDPNEFVERYGYKRPSFDRVANLMTRFKKILRWLFKPLP
jgi:hypothetical protein